MNMGEAVEEAEKLRDPSHVRNYTETEWRSLIEDAGLEITDLQVFPHTFDLGAWLERTGCTGEDAKRAVALLGGRAAGGRLTLDKIAIRAVKEA
jgi:hypothetical protein